MAWRAIPRCNNMSLRRTKSKVKRPSGDISETLMHIGHGGFDLASAGSVACASKP